MRLAKTAPYKDMSHEEFIRALRAMTDEERLRRSFELTELWKAERKARYRRYCPGLNDLEYDRVYRERFLSHQFRVCERERVFYNNTIFKRDRT